MQSGIIESTMTTATALMFVNQTTKSKDDPIANLDGSRVKVTASLVGDKWKITALQPV